MNLFRHLEAGRKLLPHRMQIYGAAGIGASSFALGLPSAVFVPADDSTSNLDFVRLSIAKRFADLMRAPGKLCIKLHDFRTVIIDPLGAVEPLISEAEGSAVAPSSAAALAQPVLSQPHDTRIMYPTHSHARVAKKHLDPPSLFPWKAAALLPYMQPIRLAAIEPQLKAAKAELRPWSIPLGHC